LKIAQEQGDECSQELIQYLRTGSEGGESPLDNVTQMFTEMITHKTFKFPITCFYETRATTYLSHLRGIPDDRLEEHGIKAEGHGVVCLLKLDTNIIP
jgi:hypothetical protein